MLKIMFFRNVYIIIYMLFWFLIWYCIVYLVCKILIIYRKNINFIYYLKKNEEKIDFMICIYFY